MKAYNWFYILICLFITISSCNENSKLVSPSNPEPELLPDSYVYLGTAPGNCGMDMLSYFFDHTWHIFVHAPDTSSFGVYFWIEPFAFGPEDSVTITPGDGISYEGDLLTGMTISWESSMFDHDSVLTLNFIDNPPTNVPYPCIAMLHDSELFLDNGSTVYLEDVASQFVYCGSYGGGTIFLRPDTFIVDSGKDAIVTFRGLGTGPAWGPVATGIHAVDELGWVGDLTPTYLWQTCSFCPWNYSIFELLVSVPPFTPTGTRDLVRILDGDQKLLTSFELIAEK